MAWRAITFGLRPAPASAGKSWLAHHWCHGDSSPLDEKRRSRPRGRGQGESIGVEDEMDGRNRPSPSHHSDVVTLMRWRGEKEWCWWWGGHDCHHSPPRAMMMIMVWGRSLSLALAVLCLLSRVQQASHEVELDRGLSCIRIQSFWGSGISQLKKPYIIYLLQNVLNLVRMKIRYWLRSEAYRMGGGKFVFAEFAAEQIAFLHKKTNPSSRKKIDTFSVWCITPSVLHKNEFSKEQIIIVT